MVMHSYVFGWAIFTIRNGVETFNTINILYINKAGVINILSLIQILEIYGVEGGNFYLSPSWTELELKICDYQMFGYVKHKC